MFGCSPCCAVRPLLVRRLEIFECRDKTRKSVTDDLRFLNETQHQVIWSNVIEITWMHQDLILPEKSLSGGLFLCAFQPQSRIETSRGFHKTCLLAARENSFGDPPAQTNLRCIRLQECAPMLEDGGGRGLHDLIYGQICI